MEIAYNLKIIGEKRKYTPRVDFINPIMSSNKKIFEITAGNGYGKTFLLNLVAFAFGADKFDDDYILKSLKDSLSRYNQSERYELDYNLSFILPDGKKLNLKKKTNNERVMQFEGQPPLNHKLLQKTVSLLYDVPTNPSERLNAVIKDLGIWNSQLESKMKDYWQSLRVIENEFTNIKDEQKIKQYIEKERQLDNEISKREEDIKRVSEDIQRLKQIEALQNLLSMIKQKDILNSEKLYSKDKIKKLNRPITTVKRNDKLLVKLRLNSDRIKREFEDTLKIPINIVSENSELDELISKNTLFKNSFEFLQKMKLRDIVNSDDYIESLRKFLNQVEHLVKAILDFIYEETKGKKYIIHNFLNNFLKQIEELINNDADDILEEITKTKSTTLKIEVENIKKTYEIKNYDNIKYQLKRIRTQLNDLVKEFNTVHREIKKEEGKGRIDSDGKFYIELKVKINKIDDKLREVNRNINNLKLKLIASMQLVESMLDAPEDIANVLASLKARFKDKNKLNSIAQEIKEKEANKINFEKQKDEVLKKRNLNKALLEIENNKGESKFTLKEQTKIRSFTKALGITVRNLLEYKKIINSLDSNLKHKLNQEENLDFVKVAGRIIAHSMDNKVLRPDGVYINFDYYDMFKEEFHCEGGVRIIKDDISTGLASANYLKQRIENIEGKYVVILLDEIGNMAKNTLEEVIKSIKKLESQNRLILALLTQPSSDGIKINSY